MTAIGEWALYNNTTGTNNIGVGPYGLGGYDIVTASHVIAIGHPDHLSHRVPNRAHFGSTPLRHHKSVSRRTSYR